MNFDKIYETNFVSLLSGDSTALAKRVLYRGKKSKLADQAKYVHLVLSSFNEVTSVLENLEYGEIFLGSYSVSSRWRKKYDRNHYIRYHYEFWVINLIRLYERLLILIDDVYGLGIPHKEVTYKTISSAIKMEGTDTLKILKKIHGALSTAQGLKNEVFHRHTYSDGTLDDITMYDFLSRQSNETNEQKKFVWAARLKAQLYLMGKRREVRKANIEMIGIVLSVLNTLAMPYKKQTHFKD